MTRPRSGSGGSATWPAWTGTASSTGTPCPGTSPATTAATPAARDGTDALPYLHQFVQSLPGLRVVVVMGGFAEHWWLQYLRRPDSPVLPLVTSPHPSVSARRSRPTFEDDTLIAMTKASRAA